ncbi:putative 60S ribosomal protein L13a-4-like [Capsicum annuum]|nr:putative 60S ribosomal protein L13a-4-like [Capsicum annuum]
MSSGASGPKPKVYVDQSFWCSPFSHMSHGSEDYHREIYTHQRPKRGKPTNHTHSPSKDSILANPTLSEEVITAILVRLPVKSLLKFKSVSKEWFALISIPHFVKTHLSFSANYSTRHRLVLQIDKYSPPKRIHRHCSVASLFYDSVTETFDLDNPVKDPVLFTSIAGSSNGLICYNICHDLTLWNPSTRKFKQLPDLGLQMTSDFHIGFGYDRVHDDYKVVAIIREFRTNYYYAKIYSLKSDSRRTMDDYQGARLYHHSGMLVNENLHWITKYDDGYGIMFIDLVDGKCSKVEKPWYGKEYLDLKLGVLGSHLSVICCHERSDVWVLKEYGVKESWTKLYTIKCPYYMLSPPLCMSIEGEILHVFRSTLMTYNPEDDLMRYPEITNLDGYDHLEAELYIESLGCPVLQNEPMAQH